MMKTMICVLSIAGALLLAPAAPAQSAFRPIAIVNDSAITGFDLAQRAQALVALGFTTANPDALRSAALDQLIEDRLKLQEGARLGITVTPELIAAGVEEFAKNAGMEGDEFRAVLSAQSVTEQALNDMVSAEMVWREVVRRRFARRIEPGEAEIDAEIALVQARAGVSYRLGEIGLPMADAGRSEAETRALADKLYAALSSGGDFAAAVKRYSRAPSAAKGGDVGWVSTLRMPADLVNVLATIEIGQVTPPQQVPGGLAILKLFERRTDEAGGIDRNDPELREQVRRRLAGQQGMRLADGLLQELRRDALIDLR